MRIIAGSAKGRKLFSLEGSETRPTSDRVKEAVFNIIAPYLYGARVLDLFAGSGALGIEALSRGAASAVFVDNNKNAVSIIKKNLALLKGEPESKVYNADFLGFIKKNTDCFDIIFIDPPYLAGYYKNAISALRETGAAAAGSIIAVEHSLSLPAPEIADFEIFTQRKYGSTLITILK